MSKLYVVAERRKNGNESLFMYVVSLTFDPYLRGEGGPINLSESIEDAFEFSERSAAEVIACTVSGWVVDDTYVLNGSAYPWGPRP